MQGTRQQDRDIPSRVHRDVDVTVAPLCATKFYRSALGRILDIDNIEPEGGGLGLRNSDPDKQHLRLGYVPNAETIQHGVEAVLVVIGDRRHVAQWVQNDPVLFTTGSAV